MMSVGREGVGVVGVAIAIFLEDATDGGPSMMPVGGVGMAGVAIATGARIIVDASDGGP